MTGGVKLCERVCLCACMIMRMCVFMCVCAYVCVCVCAYACVYVCMCTRHMRLRCLHVNVSCDAYLVHFICGFYSVHESEESLSLRADHCLHE